MKYQLVPPGDHQTNPAERAIQTFKNHFTSILYGTDDDFPANQWDRLIQIAVITLNMLRPSRINPKLSAYNQIWGNFDYNKTPLAPPGCKVVVHEFPEHRKNMAAHGKIGYFTNTVEDHYRTYEVYVPETGGERKAATVEFFPKYIQMPNTSSEDRPAETIEDLTHILKNTHPKQPFLDQGTPTNDAIQKLQEIFNPPIGDTTVSQRGVQTEPTQPKQLEQYAVPRVPEKSKTKEKHPNGTIILQKFGGRIHKGEIKKYDEERKYY